jgi:hypothetical protein
MSIQSISQDFDKTQLIVFHILHENIKV